MQVCSRAVFANLGQEIDDIFNSPNPRKASLVKKKVATDVNGNILEIEKI